MPSTHLSLHIHVIFATKDRQPWIAPEWRPRLHAYLGGVLSEMEAIPEGIGGVADHVHALIGFKATHCMADVMRNLKRSSSEWVHRTIGIPGFAWQEGYGAFSVSASDRDQVLRYIGAQEERHRVRTFEEEYRMFLTKTGAPFDPRYID